VFSLSERDGHSRYVVADHAPDAPSAVSGTLGWASSGVGRLGSAWRIADCRCLGAYVCLLQPRLCDGQNTTEAGTLTCAAGESGVKSHTCSATGEVFELACTGKRKAVAFTCTRQQTSVCSFWTGAVADRHNDLLRRTRAGQRSR
jgi:hypothetical protein